MTIKPILAALALIAALAGCASQDDWHVMTSERGVGYKIGNDEWPAGTWETDGATGPECGWARRADMTNTPESLIDRGSTQVGVKARVAVKAGEFFVSHDCLPWRYLG